jgi:hypothetical protein
MFPIFEKLGGVDEALKLLQPDSLRDTWPSRHTLKDWTSKRRALPALVAVRLMRIAEQRGIDFCSDDFRLPPRQAAGE